MSSARPRIPRRLGAALVAVALVAGPALVGPATAAPAGPSGPSVGGAASDVVAGDEPIDYVALGDSYSAGPLIPVQRADPLGCLRSTHNYPAYLAAHLDVATYVDVTCSGAETADLDRRAQKTILPGPSPAPQLDVLTDATDLVTLGIGGNDYELFGSMIEVCQEVAPLAPTGAPCRRHFTNRKGVDTKLRDADRIRKDVGRVLRGITRRAPNAEVYVVGYPRLLPQRGTCKQVSFAAGDYRWGNRVERRLNRSLRLAAQANGATYLDLYPASRGHDACAGKEAWINGDSLKLFRAADFHPFKRGMRGAAQEIYFQLSGGRTAPARVAPRAADAAGGPVVRRDAASPARLGEAWRDWMRAQG